jgi:hypothetical protein
MAAPDFHLSKSRFTAGLQCHRQLWWRTHEPEASELVAGPGQQAIFDRGHRVGALARERFPGGVLIDLPHTAVEERVRLTAEAIRDGAPAIFEASFVADDTFVAVDILERVGSAWRLVEVKSSTRVKPEYLPDVAVQIHVTRGSGLTVDEAQVMHLNRECVFPDLSNLFVRVPVTGLIEPLLPSVPSLIRGQLAMLGGPLPEVPIGPHCRSPYSCPFLPRCWGGLPEHHVTTLHSTGLRAWEFVTRGYVSITDLPEGLGLRKLAERQRVSVKSGRRFVSDDLGRALAALESPIAVLDFETIAPVVPRWVGCHPYDAVPAQFSCDVEDGSGGWIHHEWLADGPDDPRPELMRRVAVACEGTRTVLAYNADFEKRCLRSIASTLPELAPAAQGVMDRLADALPLVRNHVYDPAFFGSFSLKAVLPALVPELRYAGLAIGDGNLASNEMERMLLRGEEIAPAERERIRAELLRYCAFDTAAVVRLLGALRGLARPS